MLGQRAVDPPGRPGRPGRLRARSTPAASARPPRRQGRDLQGRRRRAASPSPSTPRPRSASRSMKVWNGLAAPGRLRGRDHRHAPGQADEAHNTTICTRPGRRATGYEAWPIPSLRSPLSKFAEPPGRQTHLPIGKDPWPSTCETREQLIDTVRRFVTERLRPLEAKVSEDDAIPDEVIEEMKGLGLFGLLDPRGIRRPRPLHGGRVPGGRGTGPHQPGLPLGLRHQCRHRQPGPGDVRDRRPEGQVPAAASPRARSITSFALTEPEAGSDSAAVQTRAVRDGDHYVLNGTKRFITNANKADLFTVMARTDPDKPRARAGITRLPGASGTCPASRSASPRRRWASRAPTSAT